MRTALLTGGHLPPCCNPCWAARAGIDLPPTVLPLTACLCRYRRRRPGHPPVPPTRPPTCLPASLQVQIQASFRPGDVVRAEVQSLGDARSYHLTTAKNELGVVYAKSVAGGWALVRGVGEEGAGWMGARLENGYAAHLNVVASLVAG